MDTFFTRTNHTCLSRRLIFAINLFILIKVFTNTFARNLNFAIKGWNCKESENKVFVKKSCFTAYIQLEVFYRVARKKNPSLKQPYVNKTKNNYTYFVLISRQRLKWLCNIFSIFFLHFFVWEIWTEKMLNFTFFFANYT